MRTTATPPGAQESFRVRVQTRSDGRVVATCDSPTCMTSGSDETEALDKMSREIRYRIEWCPCTGVDDDYVKLVVERVS